MEKTADLRLISGKTEEKEEKKKASRIPSELPICPSELCERAKTEWRYITPILFDYGLINKLDRAVLSEYCSAYALWIEMQEKIANTDNVIFVTDNGYKQQIPEVGIMNKAADRMIKACDKLGLTPYSRKDVQLGGESDDGEDILD